MAVVAVVETAFLEAMQLDVAGVHVQDKPLGDLALLGINELLDKEPLDSGAVSNDLLVARIRARVRGRQLQPIERALAGQRVLPVLLATSRRSRRLSLAHGGRQQGVSPKRVVVVEVLVAKAEAQHALPHQVLDGVLDQLCVPVIGEALREPRGDPRPAVKLAEQQRPCIRGNSTRVKRGHDCPLPKRLELKLRRDTVCLHRAPVWFCFNTLILQD